MGSQTVGILYVMNTSWSRSSAHNTHRAMAPMRLFGFKEQIYSLQFWVAVNYNITDKKNCTMNTKLLNSLCPCNHDVGKDHAACKATRLRLGSWRQMRSLLHLGLHHTVKLWKHFMKCNCGESIGNPGYFLLLPLQSVGCGVRPPVFAQWVPFLLSPNPQFYHTTWQVYSAIIRDVCCCVCWTIEHFTTDSCLPFLHCSECVRWSLRIVLFT